MFINSPSASSAPTAAGNFRVKSTSMAINMGNNGVVTTLVDLDEKQRIINTTVDIGAYEYGSVTDCSVYSGVTTIYVDSSAIGSENGLSWMSAFTSLQDALTLARTCNIDSIKVAKGTYYPSVDTVYDKCTGQIVSITALDRNISFDIPANVILIGGYLNGGSTEASPFCNKTILCGDINKDKTINGNSYHVVTTYAVGTATVVDGFCITDGYADNTGGNGFVKYGGGWLNRGVGGVESSPTILNCVFNNNQTGTSNNNFGGGAFASFADDGNTNPTMINCILHNNLSLKGGAIRTYSVNNYLCNLTIINSILSGNKASNVASNDNGERGGAIFNDGDGTTLSLINTVLSGNHVTSPRQGGALYNNNFGSSKPTATLTNCIVWDDAVTGNYTYFNLGSSGIDISYSIIGPASIIYPGNGSTPGTGTFNNLIGNKVGVNPLFVNAPTGASAPTATGDFHVMSGSPALDMGLSSANTYPTDLDNNKRILGTQIDIGAYEADGPDCAIFAGLNVVYVDSSATGKGDGTSWANAFTDLQDALRVTRVCGVDTVKVAQGTYYPSDSIFVFDKCTDALIETILPNKSISFDIPDSAVILGGYGHGADSVNRDWECNKTILCGDIDRNGMLDLGNSIHVVTTKNVDSATIVDGFCITGGNASETYTNYPDFVGGGWYDHGSGSGNGSFPTIINCNISGNRANGGGGVFCDGTAGGNSSPKLINCILSGNLGYANGGAMFNDGNQGTSSPKLINCVIAGNLAYFFDGAGMYNSGINSGTCLPYIANSIFWNNSAYQNGGVANSNVFHNNEAHPIVSNCILQGVSLNDPATVTTVTTSGNNTDGGNNKFTDPLFISSSILVDDAANKSGNYHVLSNSPAINMGLNVINDYPYDYGSSSRVLDGIIDIGAYETAGLNCSAYAAIATVYVDSAATGLNTGTSWADAFTDLQDGLAAVRCGADTIKVAKGTYYPSSTDTMYDKCSNISTIIPLNREVSFNIPDSVVVLGGYPAGGGVRDPHCNKTILSGDIQQDQIDTNNSYHVVTTNNVSDHTIVDGFCITKGYAVYFGSDQFPTFRNAGGGWLNNGITPMGMPMGCVSNPRILNCTFTDNHGLLGAGLCNLGIFGTASPYIYQSNFYSDSAILGGGIANIGYDGESSPIMIGVKVQGNTGVAAGGILNIAGSVNGLVNFAPLKGGLRSSSTMPSKLKEAFEKSGLMEMVNSMSHQIPSLPGGPQGLPAQIPGFGVSSPHIKNSLITGNAAFAGGGIVNYVLNFSTIGLSGGESSPQIINTTIAGNSALVGGGMLNSDEGFVNDETGIVKPCIVNSVFWNNTGFDSDPDMYNNFNGSGDYADTIKFHHNISESDYGTLTNNIIAPHYFDTTLSGNKYQVDPLFVNGLPGTTAATTAGNYHLKGTSPAINMGDNAACTEMLDLDLKPRVIWGTIDLGPYEFLLNCDSLTIYVEANGTVPLVPIDSILGAKLNPECSFFVNGTLNTTGIQLACTDTGINNIDLLVTRPGCAGPDTIAFCTKVITLLDTFPKNFTAISQLNISLDANCMFFLTPYDVLANFKGCSNDFEVHIQYPFGTNHNVPDNKLDRSHLGYCMVFSVVQKSTGNTTWGKICVEDKFPPQVGDTVEYKTCFEFAQLPSGPSYKVADNCSDSAIVNILSESFADYGCDSALYQGLVTRHLIATDVWGNQSNLTKKIYILKVSLDSVVCARDTAVDCSLEVVNGVRITDPKRSGAPQVKIGGKLVSLWPNNLSCKLEVLYRDERQDVCGTSYKVLRTWIITDWCSKPAGQEKICKQWIEVKDTTTPVVYDTILPDYYSSPHDCGQYVDLPVLRYSDCNTISETYLIKYYEEGILRILSGKLPVSHIWLPTGADSVEVNVIDACNNIGKGKIYINIIDNTPPTPVCDEYTQVTVDPTSCWSAVAAADLDNGSHDNCCSVLHFAAAKMDSIVYWRNYWNTRLETEVGKTEFWRDKAGYDALIEDWINCYVFSDTVHFDECGTNQVVLRVYEACGIPRLDPHVWPCSPHAWFCYNTYLYIGDFNYNWFDPKGPHSCQYRPDLTSLSKVAIKYDSYFDKGYLNPKFIGSAQYNFCNVPFYFGQLGNISKFPPNGGYCSARLYNDCMVNVLVDDKQAPVVDHLEDVTVYCDGAPDWADYPSCDDMYPSYPGELRDSKGIVHGYYGGSSQYDVHMGTGDHNDPQACDQNRGWAPIYCKNWLYLDSFDRGGKVNLSDYFEKPVLVDKKRPLDHTLKASEFTFTDNCRLDDASLTVTNNGTINGCGEGWISRTWTIKDKCGNAVSATQKIIVKHRSDFEVIFPADKKVTCDFLNRTDTSELGAGKPKLSDDDCEQLGVTYKDEIFTIVDSACYKIVRTWTIIDWCIYNPNQQKRYPDVIVNDSLRANTTDRACVYRSLKDNNDGYIQYVQIIKVIDELKPHITDCSDQTVCIDKDCATSVNIPLSGTDNCSDQIRFRADITRPDGTHDKRSDITAITGSGFTAGAYKIQVIAKDQCGNEDTCNFTLTIKDCKKPTPYCLNGIATVVMPSTGSVQVWAKDFDKGASDNCTEASKLKFSFTKNTADAGKVLTCANIPNGKEQPINVEVWVTDEAGNQDFCSTYILLQDNGDASNPGGVCKDTAALVANVTGKLLTEEQEGVEFANVDVQGMQGMPSIVTSTDGSYSFSSIPMNTDHVSIKALRDDNPMNGVSTLDLVLIQKHILGTESLKSPYKMIAADVDNSNDISAIDLLELRKLILGLYDKLPNNTSWKFIPKSYTFSDPSNPWSYPTEDVLTDNVPSASGEKMIRDFVGVKIGDVNSTAAAHNLMGTEIRSGETGLIFEVQDQVFKAGDKVSVEFRSPNFKGVSGFQGTLQCTMYNVQRNEPTSYIVHRTSYIEPGILNFTESNIGRRWEHEGLITMSWNTNTSIDLKDDAVLFTMHFTAQTAGRLSDVLRIGSQHTNAESYEGKGELGNLSIRFVGKDGKEVAGKSELYQNYPNPFDQRTVIGLNLANGVKGNLKITDVTGRVVKLISKEWNKGYNEIWLDRSELQATGILFYSFESKDFTATKRMILIQ